MYTPRHFEATQDLNEEIIEANGFGIISSLDRDNEIKQTLTPMFLKDDVMIGHIARANNQWKDWQTEGNKVTLLFLGPHAYISPTFYVSPKPAVPTWNYISVTVTGTVSIVDDPAEVAGIFEGLLEKYEKPFNSEGWLASARGEFFEKLLGGIVCFKINDLNFQGTFKLSQNKSAEDRAAVCQALSSSGSQTEKTLADFMMRGTTD